MPESAQVLSDRIGKALLDAQASEDKPLTEVALAERFGVSRTPIREALKELERDGLIERRQKKGIYLAKPSLRDVAEVYDLRAALEGFAARRAAANATETQLDEMETLAHDFEQARLKGDTEEEKAINIRFHERLIELSDNHLLRQVMSRFQIITLTFRMTHEFAKPGVLTRTTVSHTEIVDRMRKKDMNGLEKAMRQHILQAKKKLLEHATGANFE